MGKLLVVSALIIAVAVYIALEYGLGRLVTRLFTHIRADVWGDKKLRPGAP